MSTTRNDATPAENTRGEWRTYGGRGELVSRVDGWTPVGKMSDSKRARIIASHDAATVSIADRRPRGEVCHECGSPLRAWEGHGQSGEYGMCHDCA